MKLAIELLHDTSTEEEQLLYLEKFDEQRHDAVTTNETHKQCIKAHYEKSVQHHIFSEGDFVLLYDQDNDKLGVENSTQYG